MVARVAVAACLFLCACRTQLLDETSARPGDAAMQPLASAPWPMRGHDAQHTGRAAARGPAAPRLRFRSALLPEHLEGTLVVAADGTLWAAGASTLYALSPADGGVRATVALDPAPDRALPPAIGDDGTIYFAVGGTLAALAADGHERWRFTGCRHLLGAPIPDPRGRVFASCDDDTIALSADGALLWRTPATGTVVGALGPDGTVYALGEAAVSALSGDDGAVRWTIAGTQLGAYASVDAAGFLYLVEPPAPAHGGASAAVRAPADGSLYYRLATSGAAAPQPPRIGGDGLRVSSGRDQVALWHIKGAEFGIGGGGPPGRLDVAGALLGVDDFVYAVEQRPSGARLWALPPAPGDPYGTYRDFPGAALYGEPAMDAAGTLYYLGADDGEAPSRLYAFGE